MSKLDEPDQSEYFIQDESFNLFYINQKVF